MSALNRTMVSALIRDKDSAQVDGVIIMQTGACGVEDNEFYVSREEAPGVIRMLADAFDIDLERVT